MPTQPTIAQSHVLGAQTQSECIYFWGPPTTTDLQRLIEKLDEDARCRELWRREMIKGTYWMREIAWQLDEANEPLRPVEVINRVTNRFRFQCWKDKFDKRVELLKVIGVMVKQGRLERYDRVKVRLPAQGQDHKFQAWVKEFSKPLNLPKPRVS